VKWPQYMFSDQLMPQGARDSEGQSQSVHLSMRLAALSFLPLFLRLLKASEQDQDGTLRILPATQLLSSALPPLHHVDRHPPLMQVVYCPPARLRRSLSRFSAPTKEIGSLLRNQPLLRLLDACPGRDERGESCNPSYTCDLLTQACGQGLDPDVLCGGDA
jgi:hypothetical protein